MWARCSIPRGRRRRAGLLQRLRSGRRYPGRRRPATAPGCCPPGGSYARSAGHQLLRAQRACRAAASWWIWRTLGPAPHAGGPHGAAGSHARPERYGRSRRHAGAAHRLCRSHRAYGRRTGSRRTGADRCRTGRRGCRTARLDRARPALRRSAPTTMRWRPTLRARAGPGRSILPLHHHCLFKLGVPLAELWYLNDLAEWLRAHGRTRFLLTAPPLGCPARWARPLRRWRRYERGRAAVRDPRPPREGVAQRQEGSSMRVRAGRLENRALALEPAGAQATRRLFAARLDAWAAREAGRDRAGRR